MNDSQPSGDPVRTIDFSPGLADEAAPAGAAETRVTPSPQRDTDAAGPDTVDHVSAGAGPTWTHPSTGPAGAATKGPKAPDIAGYEILGELGRGGMGVVYQARQVALDRVVALKMVLAGANAPPDVLGRFQVEAQAVARLQHPNIVQIYEVGEADGLPYFSLEFVPGGSLSKKIAREPQEPRFAAATVEALARAMQFAHERGIVHRDLKPANVLLAADGTPKITDFGLAKRLGADSGHTQSGAVMGTPSFMAPEQATGAHDRIGPAADVYALGAILYDLLTGRPPFAGTTVLDTLEMVRTREPAAPSQLAAKVPKDLETISLKCLQKDPAKRYATAGELADDLRRFLDGRPIVARPVSAAERAWRWAKRNPWVAGLGTSVAALLLTVAVVSSLLSWKLSIRTKEAEFNATQAENARIAAVAARNDEAAARKVTGEQRVMALDVLRKVLVRIDEKLRGSSELYKLREGVFQQALEEVDKIRDHAEKNPLADRTQALAFQRFGDLYLKSNRVADAEKQFAKADEIMAALARAEPEEPIHVRNLAGNTNYQGDVRLRLGDAAGARNLYLRGLDLRKKWRQMRPEWAPARQSIAESHVMIGRVLLQLGDPAGALEHFRAAVEEYTATPVHETMNAMQKQREIAAARKWVGDARLHLGESAAAEAEYRAVLDSQADLLRRAQGSPTVQRDLALTQMALGDSFLLARRDAARAWEEFLPAEVAFVGLLKADPSGFGTRRDLAAVQYRLGVIAGQLPDPPGGPKVSAKYLNDCLALREALARIDTKDTQSGIEYLLILARTGRQALAEKVAAQLIAVGGKDPRTTFYAACGLALASEGPDAAIGARCRDRAIQLVDELVKGGWRDRFALESDPDLDPIRKSEKFQEILARFAAMK